MISKLNRTKILVYSSALQCNKVQSSIEKFHWSKQLRKTENFTFNLNIRVLLENVNLFLHVFCVLRDNISVNFSENRFFFGLKCSLNLLEYEAKGFIHEKKFFLFNFAFFLRRVGRLEKTRFLKTARTITRTIFNIFFSNFNHIFQTTF